MGPARRSTKRREGPSDKKELIEAISPTDHRLQQVVRVSRIGVFDHDHLSDTIYWSPEQREIFGFDLLEPITLAKYLDRVYPKDRDAIVAAMLAAHDPIGDGLFDVENRIVRRDGEVRRLKTRSRTFFEGEGAACHKVRTVGAMLDITERHQIEEEKQKLVEVVQNSPDFIGIATPDGKVLFVNQAGQALVGVQNDQQATSKLVFDYLPPDEISRFSREVLPVVLSGRPWGGEILLKHFGTGELIPVEMRAFSISDPLGQVIAIATVSRDIRARRWAEQELRESEERFHAFMDNVPAIAWAKDDRGRHVYLNRSYENSFGVRLEDWQGKTDFELWPPEIARAFRRADEAVLATNKALEVIEKTSVLGNVGRTWQNIKFPFRDAKGRKYVGGIGVDITEKQVAEERLREYARVVEGLEEMILVVDQQYRYVIANRAFLNYRGLSAEQVVGHSVEDVIGKDAFVASVKEKMDECFLGTVVQYEMVYNFPNLGKRDLSVSYFPIDGPGGVDRIACILQDITQRKLAADALLKSEERFSKAFRNNPLAITISTEADGRYLDVNDAFLDLLGHTRKEVIGHTAAELQFWGDPLDRMEMVRQLKDKEQVAKHHTRFRTTKGEIREAEVWAETIELDGQPCVLAITRDVTEIRQLEAQFRQAQKMEAVGRLAGGVAHDFNNLLGVIIGYSDMALDVITPDNPVNRYLLQTKRAAQRAALLTQQLLAFSRKQVVFPKILDLNEVIRNATNMFLRLVGEDIKVEFRPTTSIGSLRADRGQVEQVLMNLVVNARDAMPTGGKIVIETAQAELDEHYVSLHPGSDAGPYVVMIVSDTGCGMDETVKSQIFEPFFTTKGAGLGTGLGLSTVYGIVKQSEGSIFVYSELGKGTTFKVYFPRVSEKAEEVVLSDEEAEPLPGSETILVVEDDKTLRELAVELLRDGGYRVVEARNAEEALRIMATSQTEIDLLLTDVVMPGKSGAELLRDAREGHPTLRWLFMSGYTDDVVTRQGMLLQEAFFLEKPFTKRSLLMKVHSVLHSEAVN